MPSETCSTYPHTRRREGNPHEVSNINDVLMIDFDINDRFPDEYEISFFFWIGGKERSFHRRDFEIKISLRENPRRLTKIVISFVKLRVFLSTTCRLAEFNFIINSRVYYREISRSIFQLYRLDKCTLSPGR